MSKEDTILEEDKTIKNGAEETVVSQSDKQPAPVADGKKRITVNKTAAVAAAVGGGAGSIFAATVLDPGDEEVVEDTGEIDTLSTESEVVVEPVLDESVVNDDMSFGEAFAAARAAYGPGSVFEWRGNVYHTNTKEEVEAQNNDEINAEVRADVVSADIVDDAEEVSSDDVQVVGVESEDVIIIDDNESAYIAEVDDVYVEVYDDPYSDDSQDFGAYVTEDPMF